MIKRFTSFKILVIAFFLLLFFIISESHRQYTLYLMVKNNCEVSRLLTINKAIIIKHDSNKSKDIITEFIVPDLTSHNENSNVNSFLLEQIISLEFLNYYNVQYPNPPPINS